MTNPPKLSHTKLRRWQDNLEQAQVFMAAVDMEVAAQCGKSGNADLLDVKAALHRTMDWAKITSIHIARMKP